MPISTILAAVLLGALSLSAGAASFDCSRATSPVETAVCSSPILSRLDEAMASAFSHANDVTFEPDELRSSQLEWLRVERGRCGSAVSCLKDAYEARIYYLSVRADADNEERHPPPQDDADLDKTAARGTAMPVATAASAAPADVPVVASTAASSIPQTTTGSSPATAPAADQNATPRAQAAPPTYGPGVPTTPDRSWASGSLGSGLFLVAAVVFGAWVTRELRRRGRRWGEAIRGGFGLVAGAFLAAGTWSLATGTLSLRGQQATASAAVPAAPVLPPAAAVPAKSVATVAAKPAAPTAQQALLPLFPSLGHLRFGSHATSLPPGCERKIRTVREEQMDRWVAKELGQVITLSYECKNLVSGIPHIDVSTVVLIFDVDTDELVEVVVGISRPAPETPGVMALKRSIDQALGIEGKPSALNGRDRNTSFDWNRVVNGVPTQTNLNSVPGGTVIAEISAKKYKNGRLPSD